MFRRRKEGRAEGQLLYQCATVRITLGVKMKQRRGAPMRSTPLLYEVKNEMKIQVVEK